MRDSTSPRPSTEKKRQMKIDTTEFPLLDKHNRYYVNIHTAYTKTIEPKHYIQSSCS